MFDVLVLLRAYNFNAKCRGKICDFQRVSLSLSADTSITKIKPRVIPISLVILATRLLRAEVMATFPARPKIVSLKS